MQWQLLMLIAIFGKKHVIKALFSGEIDIEKLDL